MSAVAETLDVARSNLAERTAGRPPQRKGRPPLPEEELVKTIKAIVAELPTYGYRRVWAILRRMAERDGCQAPNHKRVYRIMRVHGLLLQKHVGGSERRHDGRIAVEQSNLRWCPMASRSAVRMDKRSVSLLRSIAVIVRPWAMSRPPKASREKMFAISC